jgi:hypothetical protein
MGDDQRDAVHEAADKAAIEVRLEALQKTLHHIEATKHILEVSGGRPEPLELTLRNLQKLIDKAQAQVRATLAALGKSQ